MNQKISFMTLGLASIFSLQLLTVSVGATMAERETTVSGRSGYTVSSVFSDVDNYAWYTKYIQQAYDQGLVLGKTATTFEPLAKLTYAEFAVMLTNAYHGTALSENKAIYKNADWGAPYLETLKQAYGGSNDTYYSILNTIGSYSQLTRYQASFIVGMLLDTSGVATASIGDYWDAYSVFEDAAGCPWPSLLGRTAYHKVMNGTNASTFDGLSTLTRAEACVILCSLMDIHHLRMDLYSSGNAPTVGGSSTGNDGTIQLPDNFDDILAGLLGN